MNETYFCTPDKKRGYFQRKISEVKEEKITNKKLSFFGRKYRGY
jgi:hypothetical protein